ncbi:MAG: diguanylate cyclase [Thermoplasmata archaeon]|nr:diguanylate cyclase [Thermoplasmata archaeon]
MRILVADDEETLRVVISQVLAAAGHEVTTAASGEEALELFKANPFPMVVTDIVMRRMSGIELLVHVKELQPECLVVVITSHASLETAMVALKAGAYDFLIKPFEDIDMITAVVARAADKIGLAAENRRFVEQLKAKTEELERLNASLRDIADRDGLTGLHNHRYFREVLNRETARSARHGNPFSVIMLDVDGFKQFNDSFGHLAGDEALKTVANVLRNCSRASSVAARYGGEEFVVLVPEVDKTAAVVVAQRICTEIRHSVTLDPSSAEPRRFTVSLGVAGFPEDGSDPNGLLENADRALYAAKRAGRDRAMAASVAHGAVASAGPGVS